MATDPPIPQTEGAGGPVSPLRGGGLRRQAMKSEATPRVLSSAKVRSGFEEGAIKTTAAIRAFLKSLPAAAREVVGALREVVRRAAPEAQESVLWGGLSFHRPGVGGRVKGAVCLIVVKRGEVRLDFIHGVRLKDPAHLLRGAWRSKRAVPMPTVAAAMRPEVAVLIREAAALDPTMWVEEDVARAGGAKSERRTLRGGGGL